jgi:hypothetical protein
MEKWKNSARQHNGPELMDLKTAFFLLLLSVELPLLLRLFLAFFMTSASA